LFRRFPVQRFGSPSYDDLFGPPAQSSVTQGGVLGLWGGTASDNGLTFDMRFKIEQTMLTMANRCRFPDGSTLTTGVDVSIRLTDSTITVTESKSAQAVNGGNRCNAAPHPGTLNYTVAGDKLTLSDDNPLDTPIELVKISD
jgi:hypothetical protein